jgi:F-type H+-transporting ATPase subunit epsilon
MAGAFELNILTPEKSLYKGRATSVIVPVDSGYIGILCDHAPLVAKMGKGRITIKDISLKTETLDSPGNGFLEVSRNNVRIFFV